VWEPHPAACFPEHLADCLQTAKTVDVFSPNEVELLALFGERRERAVDHPLLERLTKKVLDHGIGEYEMGSLVLRTGAEGCLVWSKRLDCGPIWLPAFYPTGSKESDEVVIDPTGAGNCFLGGFSAGLLKTNNDIEAGMYGNVAASFVLEQIGVPSIEYTTEGRETWNGVTVEDRLRVYKDRVLAGENSL
jgi:sugar/nucleoside kinase (ribokinase family)